MLLHRGTLLLADDMGLGKTVQTIAALKILFSGGMIRRALIITPAGLILQWRRELYDRAPEMSVIRIEGERQERLPKWAAPRQIVLSSYEMLRNDFPLACRNTWDVIVLDEAQKIKNRNATVSRCCKRLPRHNAWALTGTPLENGEDDLASVLEFVRPNPSGALLPPLHPGFRLRDIQCEYQLRRRKKDVLKELPPRTLIKVPLELTPSQRQAYDQIKERGTEHLASLGQKAQMINVLELIMRLKQICNFCPHTGNSVKVDDLRRRLKNLQGSGHRALVFSQWTSSRFGTGRLEHNLRDFNPLVYSGALTLGERAARIDAFKKDHRHKVLILSLRAGGQGLNLQEASYVVHFDRWWNPAVENQASDRAHRMGQKNPVTVYAYLCTDTIEERIEEILETKRALFAALVDQVSLDVRTLLSAEELFGLFGLPAPAGLSAKGRPRPFCGREDRIYRLLKRSGWTEICSSEPSSLKARRYDEIGDERTLHVHFIREWDEALAESSTGGLNAFVCHGPVPEEIRREAAGRAILLLDEEGIQCLESTYRIP